MKWVFAEDKEISQGIKPKATVKISGGICHRSVRQKIGKHYRFLSNSAGNYTNARANFIRKMMIMFGILFSNKSTCITASQLHHMCGIMVCHKESVLCRLLSRRVQWELRPERRRVLLPSANLLLRGEEEIPLLPWREAPGWGNWEIQVRDRTGLAVSCLKTSDIHRTHMPVSSSQKLRSLRGSDKFVDPLYKPIHPQWSPMVSMHCQCEGPVAAVLAHGSKSFLSHQDHAHGSYARRGQDLGSLQAEEQQEQLGRYILHGTIKSSDPASKFSNTSKLSKCHEVSKFPSPLPQDTKHQLGPLWPRCQTESDMVWVSSPARQVRRRRWCANPT